MASFLLNIFLILLSVVSICAYGDNDFNENYYNHWGFDHFALVNQGTEAQIRLDNTSGSGFRSKLVYGSGLFHIRMKIPEQHSRGIITGFYLTSAQPDDGGGIHDELDFEFIGTDGILQTNVFAQDVGHREEQLRLWFDPSKDFHTYEILWNSNHILFIVDKIPIRVFKNNKARGVNYPSQPMRIEASIWNATWAGNVDWSQAPYITHYQDFSITACPIAPGSICSSNNFFWNQAPYLELSPSQKQLLEAYKKKYIVYDYCSKDFQEHPECSVNP